MSDSILEEAGVTGDVNIADLPVYFLPLEQDVFSLELDTSFGDLYLVCSFLPEILHRSNSTSTKTQAVYISRPKG